MTPVACLILAFGGVRKAARALGCQPSAVIQWRKRGLVPNRVQVLVMAAALRGEVKLSAEELILGRSDAPH